MEAGVFYDLHVDYKCSPGLIPVVWITEGSGKNAKPIRMLRLPESSERTVFRAKVTGGANRDGSLMFFLYPGVCPDDVLGGGDTPVSVKSGRADFYGIRLTPSAFESESPPDRSGESCRTETVVYKTVGGRDLIMKLDFPERLPESKMPVVFWVHGGGWVSGSPDNMLWRAKPLAVRGIANARVQYRLASQDSTFPETFQDLLDAVQWLRDHADEYRLDMSRLVIGGGSAGAQLSSVLAQKTPECIGYIGKCGIYNFAERGASRFGKGEKFLMGRDPDVVRAASAIYNIRADPPAALLIHGNADATIDFMQSVHFAEELRKRGGRVDLLILEGTGHDFGYPSTVEGAVDRFLASLGYLQAGN